MPTDGRVKTIALYIPCVEFGLEGRKVGNTAVKALACKSSKFDFGNIEPRAMFWCVVDFETIKEVSCLFW